MGVDTTQLEDEEIKTIWPKVQAQGGATVSDGDSGDDADSSDSGSDSGDDSDSSDSGSDSDSDTSDKRLGARGGQRRRDRLHGRVARGDGRDHSTER